MTYKVVNYYACRTNSREQQEIIHIKEEYLAGKKWECCGEIIYSEIVSEDVGNKWSNFKKNMTDGSYIFSKKGFEIPKENLRDGQFYQPILTIPPIK